MKTSHYNGLVILRFGQLILERTKPPLQAVGPTKDLRKIKIKMG